jgi:hypothetical protein
MLKRHAHFFALCSLSAVAGLASYLIGIAGPILDPTAPLIESWEQKCRRFDCYVHPAGNGNNACIKYDPARASTVTWTPDWEGGTLKTKAGQTKEYYCNSCLFRCRLNNPPKKARDCVECDLIFTYNDEKYCEVPPPDSTLN